MERLFSNPLGLLALCCVGGLILGLNLTLLGILRGDKRFQAEASRLVRAFGGGRATAQRQNADYDELRRRVAKMSGDDPAGPKQDASKDG